MRKIILFYHVLLVVAYAASARILQQKENGTLRAAVFEHLLLNPWECTETVCSREKAVELMELNLEILRSVL